MANTALIPALAKTLIAIAWADGELHREEEINLKEVLGLLPPMSAKEWAVIELYLAAPILPEEREELLLHTCGHIRGVADKTLALEAVDNMLHADGVVRPEEEIAAEQARAAFNALDVSPVTALWRMLSSTFGGRPAREADLELWRTNPVAYYLKTQPEADGAGAANPVVALAAAIMAQVARVAPDEIERERRVMVEAFTADWGLSPEEAESFAEAALAVSRREVDYHRLSRELVPLTSEVQRLHLLDTLFRIANAADRVALEELDAIRVIASRLQLSGQQFVAAKLKIAPEDRGRM